MLENSDITLSTVSIRLTLLFVYRPHECYKLARNNPIQVTVLHPLIVFIFLDVECLVIVPPTLYCEFKSLEAVLHCAIVIALALASIAIASEYTMVRSQ